MYPVGLARLVKIIVIFQGNAINVIGIIFQVAAVPFQATTS